MAKSDVATINPEQLAAIEEFLPRIDGFTTLAFGEQTTILVYAATKIAGLPSITGSGVDKLRAELKLDPCNSAYYLTVGSQAKPRRFLKRPRGYVLVRGEEVRIASLAPTPQQSAPKGPRAVVLTALQLEFAAVTSLLSQVREEEHPTGTIYNRGILAASPNDWEVFVVEVGPGNTSAAVEAERAINHYTPDVALFLGVAGGVKDVELGDVVVATKVYGYESGKAKANKFLPRPDVGRSSYRLEQRAKAEARKPNWRSWSQGRIPNLESPTVFVGPIAAGEKVVSSRRSEVALFLKDWYSDALAVEMEGRGFLEATHSNNIDAAIVRGVSDLLSGKNLADRAGWQQKAAHRAAAFGIYLLTQFSPPRLTKPA